MMSSVESVLTSVTTCIDACLAEALSRLENDHSVVYVHELRHGLLITSYLQIASQITAVYGSLEQW